MSAYGHALDLLTLCRCGTPAQVITPTGRVCAACYLRPEVAR